MTAAKWIVILMTLAFIGCTTGPKATLASAESDAAAKHFEPPDDRANLYIARSNDSAARASFDMMVDGKSIGPIEPGMFYLVTVEPGRHSIIAMATLNSAKVTLDAQAGRNYFYEVTSSGGGLAAQPSLGFVLLEEMGKLMVRQNRRAQSSGE